MRITYQDDDLKALCEQEKVQKRRLGAECAKKLRRRLADLSAASHVTALVAGRPHPLERNRLGQFALDLDGGKRLVFEPANSPVPQRTDSSVAWENVTEVRIVFIGDYHD
jgi:proteic killer suppression protein